MIRMINIEDSEADYELIIYHLKKGGIENLQSIRIQSTDELRRHLKDSLCDIVICDYNVPGVDPLDALSIVREYSPYVPFIVVSGQIGEESVADMMNAGVEDFVIKSRLERLATVMKRALREFEVQVQEAKSRAIAKKAFADKEEMLAIVYHDIKSPLAAIALDAQMLELLSFKEPSPQVMNELRLQSKRVLRTVNRVKKLVSELLEQNAPGQLDKDLGHSFVIHAHFDNPITLINDVLDSFRPLMEEKHLKIKKIFDVRSTSAFFDKERLYQVLSNLLGNAIKFSPRAELIVVSLKELDNGDFQFSISDNGVGIAKKDLVQIFEKYWTSGSGNGLGLYICKSIVEAHGGVIEVRTDEGKGATFLFTIPYRKSSTSFNYGKLLNETNQIMVKNIKTIYVIDDDQDLREVISWALEKEGYRVFSYQDPQAALNDLGHTFFQPDLIILDYYMAKMNGDEFLQRLKGKEKGASAECPVVMISAAPKEIEKIVDPSLLSDVLNKPLDLNKLIATVESHVH